MPFAFDLITRSRTYYERHGFLASLRRLSLQVRRSLFEGRVLLFYWDLRERDCDCQPWPSHLTVERKRSRGELAKEDWTALTTSWNAKLSEKLFLERFEKGASLWIIRSNAKLAGFCWSVTGRAMEPYFYPFATNDGYLFDMFVFPCLRGQHICPWLVNHVLDQFVLEGVARANVEIAEWNTPSVSTTAKAAYVRHFLGAARKFSFFGRTVVIWCSGNTTTVASPEFVKRTF